jgi:hypothetical protein
MGESVMTYSFQRQLDISHQASDHPIWGTLYKSNFKNIVNIRDCRKDLKKQRLGIDREIILSGGKVITVDEKIRTEPWKDIALEFISVDTENKAGWVANRSLQNDYIAYVVLPLGVGYFMNLIPLQNAWELNKKEWMDKYPVKKVPNKSYYTYICCVPKDVVFDAIKNSFLIKFDPIKPNFDSTEDFLI